MGILIAAVALIAGYGTAYVASDEVRYLTRAGFEETRLLTSRVPIVIVASDSTRPDSLRQMAGLVVEVRRFAAELGLAAKETYTTYSDVGRDTLLLVLTASPKSCLCPVTWKYPIVGTVPYKGFFNFDQGRKHAAEYEKKNYDVNLRPSAAFSTLGWFNDPLLSTALSRDSVELAALVFHEIAHNTVWVKDATAFNESFAQWVAYAAAQRFFTVRGDSISAARAAARWHDERVLDLYYRLLMGKLDSLYALKLSPAANDLGRESISRWSRDTMAAGLGPLLKTIRADRVGGRPINNAALLGVRLYRTNLDLFDAWGHSFQDDLFRALEEMQLILSDVRGQEQAIHRVESALEAHGVQRIPVDSVPVARPDTLLPRPGYD